MKRRYIVFIYFLVQFAILPNVIHAQFSVKDSSSQQFAFNKAVGTYFASEGKQSPIFNGQQYFDYPLLFKGSAYFMDTKAFTNGNILFDGIWYPDIKMLYDLKNDMVVVLLFNNFTKIALVKQKIARFEYLDHHFKNINSDTIKYANEIPSGFYSEPYVDKTEVLVKYEKEIITTSGLGSNPVEYNFTLFDKYYLMVDKHYYRIRGNSTILEAFKDKKKEIKRFIRKENVSFYDNPEESLIKIATYYDRLKN